MPRLSPSQQRRRSLQRKQRSRVQPKPVDTPPMLRCFICKKVSATTESEAWTLAESMFVRFGGDPPTRVYACKSGFFHWTSS